MNATDEYKGFVRSVIADRDDDTVRLALADWLQERGDEPRAEFIRVQCALNREYVLPNIWCATSGPTCSDPECSQRQQMHRCGALKNRESELFDAWAGQSWFSYVLHLFDGPRMGDIPGLPTGMTPSGVVLRLGVKNYRAQLVIRRGFVDEIICTADDWLHAADRIYWDIDRELLPVGAQPIRKITLTEIPVVGGIMRGLARKWKYDWLPTEFSLGQPTVRQFVLEMFTKEWPRIVWGIYSEDGDGDTDPEPAGLEESAPHI